MTVLSGILSSYLGPWEPTEDHLGKEETEMIVLIPVRLCSSAAYPRSHQCFGLSARTVNLELRLPPSPSA